VTEEDLAQEGRALIDQGDYSQARSSLLVAISLFPDSARINYDFWKACCLARDDARANSLLGDICQKEDMLSQFCELILVDLRQFAAGNKDAGNFVRSGILIPSKTDVEAPLEKCLSLLFDGKEEADDGSTWNILLSLGKLTDNSTALWWRACEFTFELDTRARGEMMGEDPFSTFCTEWSKLLAVECVGKVMKGEVLKEEELVKVQPYIERSVLHHFGLGDWVAIRSLMESFVGCCPPEALKNFPLRNAPAPRAATGGPGKHPNQHLASSRLVSSSITNAVCQSLSSKSGLGDLHPVVGYLCLLGSYLVDLLRYSLFCRYGSEDTVSLNATCSSVSEAQEVADNSHEGASVLSGWFYLTPGETPRESADKEKEGVHDSAEPSALGKRGRAGAEEGFTSAVTTAGANGWRKDIQMSLSRQLKTLSSIWEAFMDPAIQNLASDHVKMQSQWGVAFSQLNDVMMHIAWHRNDKKDVEDRLTKMCAFSSLSPIEKARTKLQKMVFTESSSSMKLEGSLSDSLREILQETVSSGHANKLQWYENEDYNDIFTVHGIKDRYTFQHFPLTWSEILLHAIICCEQQVVPKSLAAEYLLLLAQVRWPRLAEMAERFLQADMVDVHSLASKETLTLVYNVELLELLFNVLTREKARGSNEKKIANTRQLLEKQMSGLGKESAGTFTVSTMLEKLLALNGRREVREE